MTASRLGLAIIEQRAHVRRVKPRCRRRRLLRVNVCQIKVKLVAAGERPCVVQDRSRLALCYSRQGSRSDTYRVV